MDWQLIIAVSSLASLSALLYSGLKARRIGSIPVESDILARISGYIADGAAAFLSREYAVIAIIVPIVAALLAIFNGGILKLQAGAFVAGAACSALSGWFGMKVATKANARTAQAAGKGMAQALALAFAGGSVMGMTVVGLALLGASAVVMATAAIAGGDLAALSTAVLPVLSGFSLGASTIALFARVGGGIYTKAADVGADLVGKVEAGIPEDDHRNPAVIADNVGDNVGDVAGMGADLFESYAGSLVGCAVLGIGLAGSDGLRIRLAFFPFAAAAVGILTSLAGTLFVRMRPGTSPQKALNAGSFGASGLAVVLLFPVARLILGDGRFGGADGAAYGYLGVALAAVIGLEALGVGLGTGALIGIITEFFTGTDTAPVKRITKACTTGPATAIISGLGVGMMSTMPPILIIGAAIAGSFALGGLYGIGVAGLGMLLTLGIQLSVDAYGPIADNAGGLAVMAEMPPETRGITDSLDAVGNTTAAIGKGFAIGSAALTSLILLVAFIEAAGIELATLSVTNPAVLIGMFIGAMVPYLFSALAMDAIGVAAFAMIEEVRRQFRSKPGILQGTEIPDYTRCVDISTRSALRSMVLPGVLAILAPVAAGFLGGPGVLVGLLAGSTISGVLLAIFMSNSGGAWDNAKKLIESRDVEGKGSSAHMAAVVGDTVGDPFKDTAGPSLN
ncbi:sodium-translocating pyrophosphatase, partial [bacterium]|nr:sodium-translocating pyrophosphatase [bacterium]